MMTQTDYWRLFEETGDIGYYLVYKYYAGNVESGAPASASSHIPAAGDLTDTSGNKAT
ncbi:MAG: hypothetical protein LBS51_05230 [Oscillospiraceae bacterium]|jgi:hypothetical protein|nr:hypothetical protein [Oscillospiraceae bacterium]